MAGEMTCNVCLMTQSVEADAFTKMGAGENSAFEAGVVMGMVMSRKAEEHGLRDIADASMCKKHETIAAMIGALIDVQFKHAAAESEDAERHGKERGGSDG